MLTIGIVIYNEESQLQRLEQNLALLAEEAIAVILIDNASTDHSPGFVLALAEKYGCQIFWRTTNQMAAARAQVVSAARTTWVGFIDADCEISRDWMFRLQSSLSQGPAVSALGGPLRPEGEQKLIFQRLFKSFLGNMNSAQVKNFADKEFVAHLPTANVVYRRQDILDLGNFDLSKVSVGEDLEMSYRLSAAGKMLQIDPALAVDHYISVRYFAWLGKIFRYGRARGQVGIKYHVLGTYPFMIPLLFFSFLVTNIVFFSQWAGVPVAVYLAVVFAHALYHGRTLALILFAYFLGTHLAYSFGMVDGICKSLLTLILSPASTQMSGTSD